MSKSNIQPKKKEEIRDAVDIILNTEDDGAAIKFLQETLKDDFPELDLGRMNLHEAIGILGGDTPKKEKKTGFENIEKALEMLNMKKRSNSGTRKVASRSKRTTRKKKRKK